MQVLIITTIGDPELGIPAKTWEIEAPFTHISGLGIVTQEWKHTEFRRKMCELYGELYGAKCEGYYSDHERPGSTTSDQANDQANEGEPAIPAGLKLIAKHPTEGKIYEDNAGKMFYHDGRGMFWALSPSAYDAITFADPDQWETYDDDDDGAFSQVFYEPR